MKHDFKVLSTKTASKEGKKYLGKDGSQAWRVTTMIDDVWHANMIFDEELLPVKGKSYNIELSENEGFKNWTYKLQTKKEQILEQTKPTKPTKTEEEFIASLEPPLPTEEVITETKPRDFTEEARGKTRCQVSCAYIKSSRTLNEDSKKEINDWIDFIFTGQ